LLRASSPSPSTLSFTGPTIFLIHRRVCQRCLLLFTCTPRLTTCTPSPPFPFRLFLYIDAPVNDVFCGSPGDHHHSRHQDRAPPSLLASSARPRSTGRSFTARGAISHHPGAESIAESSQSEHGSPKGALPRPTTTGQENYLLTTLPLRHVHQRVHHPSRMITNGGTDILEPQFATQLLLCFCLRPLVYRDASVLLGGMPDHTFAPLSV
jgi:hypothetical protein